MKAALFDPYLNTFGGGERYFLTLVYFLLKKGWNVDIFGGDNSLIEKAYNLFKIDIKGVTFVNKNLSLLNLFKKYKILSKYDLCFYISDGSLPFLFSKKNLLHFQVPFLNVGGESLVSKLKLKTINKVICNSCFTKEFVDKEFAVVSTVIYPPVNVEEFRPNKKENLIVSVGRFTDLLHNKRQDLLIKVFKKLSDEKKGDWRLILAGGAREGKKLVEKLRELAKGYSVEFRLDVSFDELKEIYGRAKIFWMATGYGLDEEKEPEKMEHFGITTIEAMAAGCVPVVIGKGGQKEIIDPGKDGFLWQGEEELLKLTRKLLFNESLRREMADSARNKSILFSERNFFSSYDRIIEEIMG